MVTKTREALSLHAPLLFAKRGVAQTASPQGIERACKPLASLF